MKILVVDDSIAMRMMVIRTAKKAGLGDHDYHEAIDGEDALEKVQQSKPDLILADWNMPKMTGIELLEALNKENIKVKFGFVTTEGTADMRLRARKAGALFLIAKPFTVQSFEQALWRALK